MKRTNPFPSVSILLPDDIVEDNDSTVASYWMAGDSCLLQISSFLREREPQFSAAQRLSERMEAGGEWKTFKLPQEIPGCETAAALTTDTQGVCWIHVYLVWGWLAVHATVSQRGEPTTCDWAWNSLASIRPTVI